MTHDVGLRNRVDPHKNTHTAVALDRNRRTVGQLETRDDPQAAARLRRWAGRLAQDLIAAGEDAVDAPSKLSAQVRKLGEGAHKDDQRDAASIATAAVHAKRLRPVVAEGAIAIVRILLERRDDLDNEPDACDQPPPRSAARAHRRRRPVGLNAPRPRRCSRRSDHGTSSPGNAGRPPSRSWLTSVASNVS